MKELVYCAGTALLLTVVGWLFLHFCLLTPQQRFIDECSETYLLVDCYGYWQRQHPPEGIHE